MILIEENGTAFNNRLADMFLGLSEASIKTHNRFDVALCGGSTPRGFHQKLAQPPYNKAIDWPKIHLFWVDDRCVPSNSPDSNYGNAKIDFIDKVAIPVDQVHSMGDDPLPESGAVAYQRELNSVLGSSETGIPVFDLILLGVGEDGHVASLFPGADEILGTKWVAAVKGGKPNVYRLTLTYPVINSARTIIFLVSGKSKANIVYKIFNQPEFNLPAQRIRPINGTLIWAMDKKAASMLKLG